MIEEFISNEVNDIRMSAIVSETLATPTKLSGMRSLIR
jgi:hypothetical protein